MEFTRIFVCVIGLFVGLSQGCTPEEQEECQLPNCLCPSTSIPGGLQPNNTPQIVYITFDDAINGINYKMYEDILFPRKNPNGHSITGTFYISHDYNDYNRTYDLYRRGHEIALHSISHKASTDHWKNLSSEGWEEEIIDQRAMMSHFAMIPEAKLTGMRAPFLQTGGDRMMGVMHGELQYDCSRPTLRYMEPGLWPYTLDYNQEFQDCQIQPCAINQYKGFWNVPMIDFIGDNGAPCAMLDTCQPDPNTTDKVVSLLKRNFLRSYEGNRAPVGLFTHAAWLSAQFEGHRSGYIDFLDYLSNLDDVFLMSVERALEWVRNPTPLSEIKDFKPWHVEEKPYECWPSSCHFPAEDTPFEQERYMMSCATCPSYFPWKNNTYGKNPPQKY